MSVRFALKDATDEVHRELDERLSRLDLGNADDYRRFLLVQARTVPAIETALIEAGIDRLVPGWSAHRRGPAIRSDLAALGAAMPGPVRVPAIKGVGDVLGTAYVLEGSRLGGQVLARQIGAGLPASYLGTKDLRPWTALVAALESLLYSDDLVTEAKRSAGRCFTLFLKVADEVGI